MFKDSLVRWLFSGLLSLGLVCFAPWSAHASSVVPPFQVSIKTSTPATSVGKIRLSESGPPIQFEANISAYFLSGNVSHDIYFGVVDPDRRVFSWVPVTRAGVVTASLVEGLVAMGRGVVFDQARRTITSTELVGGVPIAHQFAPSDRPGLYFLFSFVVPAGSDPADTDNWLPRHDSMFFAVVP